MKLIKLITVTVILLNYNCVMTQQESEIIKLPKLNNQRTQNIDIKHIAIDLKFDWTKKQAFGNTSITFSPVKPSDKITLDAGMLTIKSITIGNKSLTYEYDGGDIDDNLLIILDMVYNPGEELTIVITYNTNYVNQIDPNNLWGSYGKGLRFYEPTINDPLRPREIWSSGEPYGNRYWFPCFDSPGDLRTTEFTATVDKNLTAVSNGKLTDEIENNDGTKTFHWKADNPYSNHLTSFVVSEYINVKQKYGNVEINNFGYPREKEWIEATTERLPDMMRFYSEITGVEYPYQSYSQAFVQEIPGGMDNMMFSIITENMVDDKPTHADFFYLWDAQEAQMLASQWFGSYVTPASYEHAWLNESFARYFDELYAEHKNGHDEFQLWYWNYDMNTYLWDWNNGVRRPVVTLNYDEPETMIRDNYSFVRGAMVLHMLRKHLGEEKWQKAINLYLKSNANKLVTTADFQKAVEYAVGEPMDWFFEQWVYKMGHPVFDVSYKYDSDEKQVILTVKQTQKPDPNNEYPQSEYFKGKMDIKIDNLIHKINIEAEELNEFRLNSKVKPKLVCFDYDGVWIKEVTFNKSQDELLYQFLNDDDALSRNRALGKLTEIAKNEKTSKEEKEKILAAFRKVISGNSYWRVRLSVLSQLQGILAPAWESKAFNLDEETRLLLMNVIENDSSWTRAGAISFLGMTRDEKYTELYLKYLNDESFRVINSAAIALSKTKSPKAFDALTNLLNKPSMKNQSMLCVLGGLRELGDERGVKIAIDALGNLNLSRWRLPTPPVWDYRITAASYLASIGKGGEAYPMIFERLKTAVKEDDLSGVFNIILLIIELKEPKGQEAFDFLKEKYAANKPVLESILQHETMFKNAVSGG